MLLLKRIWRNLLLLALFSGFFSQLRAEFVISDSTQGVTSLRTHARYFKTDTGTYSIQQIIKQKEQLPFEPLTNSSPNLGFTKSRYWVHYKVVNSSTTRREFLLETARPIIDSVTLYTVQEGKLKNTQYSGDAIPFAKRSVAHRNTLFKLELDAGQTAEYFIAIKSDGESLMMPLDLYTNEAILTKTYNEQLFYGFFYGLLVLATVIYLFFFFALHDKTFLYYPIYVIFIGLLQFSLDGFFYQYLTPQSGWLYNRAVLLIALVGAFFLGKYAEVFLDTKKNAPIIHKVFKGIYVAMGLTVVMLLTAPGLLHLGYPIANALGLMVLLLILTTIGNYALKRIQVDGFFIAGIGFLVLGFVLFIFHNFNVISNSFLADNAAKIGIGLEVIFLSTSMSNRIRMLRLENEANQQLALQRAKDMNDIKSLFLSNISHELRTPLNLIMGVTSSLHHHSNDQELQEKYELVLNSSKNLLGSIEDILNFTLVEKGNQFIKNCSFELEPTVNRLTSEAHQKAEERGLKFTTRIEGELPHRIFADQDKLAQVISNLLDNAVKFTESGEVMLVVSASEPFKNTVSLEFKILDTGIGISEEKMNTIFESFTKKSFNDKREFGGLGLGLYLAKTYVDLMGGIINVRNRKIGGVECKVNLTYEVDCKEPKVNKPASEGVILNYDLEGCRILLVEDNMMNQMVVNLLVSRWENAHLDIANNGQEGLLKAADNEYDVILMDLQMPVMDGFEAISALRGGKVSDYYVDIPILAVTADITDKTKKLVFDLGVNDYLTKPIDGDLLYTKIMGLYHPQMAMVH